MSAIPNGSLVLVTGANGFIGSHVADQFLAAGYRVRGTVRSESKGSWLKALFDKKYGPDKFEIAIVSDMTQKGAFDEAMHDATGVAHVATNLVYNADAEKLSSPDIIPQVTTTIAQILASAASHPNITRFVLTSSSTAATNPGPNLEFTITSNSWNQHAIDAAYAPPPYTAERRWDVYGASKTLAEQTLWKFMQENQGVGFVANSVLPNVNLGPFLSAERQAGGGSTATWVVDLLREGLGYQRDIPPQYFVDVRDNARLHVAALTDPDIVNERVFAFAEPFNWSDVLRVLRKLRPEHRFPADSESEDRDMSTVAGHARAVEILKKRSGREGFVGLEEAVAGCIAHLE